MGTAAPVAGCTVGVAGVTEGVNEVAVHTPVPVWSVMGTVSFLWAVVDGQLTWWTRATVLVMVTVSAHAKEAAASAAHSPEKRMWIEVWIECLGMCVRPEIEVLDCRVYAH